MIFIDTDVFVIDLRYKNDKKYKQNKTFLDIILKINDDAGKATTSIFNLLDGHRPPAFKR